MNAHGRRDREREGCTVGLHERVGGCAPPAVAVPGVPGVATSRVLGLERPVMEVTDCGRRSLAAPDGSIPCSPAMGWNSLASWMARWHSGEVVIRTRHQYLWIACSETANL